VRRGSLTGLMVMNTIMLETQTAELVSVSRIRFPSSCERARVGQSLAGTRDYVTDLNSKFHQNGKLERACGSCMYNVGRWPSERSVPRVSAA
jgi:hypothetical protein